MLLAFWGSAVLFAAFCASFFFSLSSFARTVFCPVRRSFASAIVSSSRSLTVFLAVIYHPSFSSFTTFNCFPLPKATSRRTARPIPPRISLRSSIRICTIRVMSPEAVLSAAIIPVRKYIPPLKSRTPISVIGNSSIHPAHTNCRMIKTAAAHLPFPSYKITIRTRRNGSIRTRIEIVSISIF